MTKPLPMLMNRLGAMRRNRFARFLVVGGINTLFGYGVFSFFIMLGLHYAWAALLGQVCGMLFNFKTYGAFVFGNHGSRRIPRFAGVYAFIYLLNLGGLKLLLSCNVYSIAAQAILLLPIATMTFLLNRRYVFCGGA